MEIVWYDMLEGGISFQTPLPLPSVADLKIVWIPITDNPALLRQNGYRSSVPIFMMCLFLLREECAEIRQKADNIPSRFGYNQNSQETTTQFSIFPVGGT
jgi:hypothetical protein